MLDGDKRVVAIYVHAQVHAGIGHLGAHVAQANHADALALEFASHKGLLGFLGVDQDVGVLGVVAHPLHGLHHATAGKDEGGKYDLLHGVGVGAGGVKYHDAALGVLLDGDIIHTGTTAGDGANAFGQLVAVQVGRAHEDGVGVLGLVYKLVAVAKFDRAVFGDVVDGFDFTHGSLLVRNVARGGNGDTA